MGVFQTMRALPTGIRAKPCVRAGRLKTEAAVRTEALLNPMLFAPLALVAVVAAEDVVESAINAA